MDNVVKANAQTWRHRLIAGIEKHPPTFAAALCVLLLSTAVTYYHSNLKVTGSDSLNAAFALTVLANIFFFFAYEAYSERNPRVEEAIKHATHWEWWIRFVNHLVLLSLSFALQFGLLYFLLSLALFYALVTLWDFVIYGRKVFRVLRDGRFGSIIFWDFLGLLNTLFFIISAMACALVHHPVMQPKQINYGPIDKGVAGLTVSMMFYWIILAGSITAMNWNHIKTHIAKH